MPGIPPMRAIIFCILPKLRIICCIWRKQGDSRLPILHVKPDDAAEFSGVVGDERVAAGDGNGRNHQVVRPDDAAICFKLVADAAINRGRCVIEGKRGIRRKQTGENGQAPLAVAVFLRAVQQLGLDHGTENDVSGLEPFQTRTNR